jgi:glycosyltransferase involved in cell wall biosynthesis
VVVDGVSFVTTVYNKARYLPDVIAALARQAVDGPRQFIFVDDGSTDGSAGIVETLTAGWPETTVLRQANGGPTAATNAGIAMARHRYLKLVGSDDVLAPFATAYLIEAMGRTKAAAVFARLGFYRDMTEISFDEAACRSTVPSVPADGLGEAIRRGISGTTQTLYRTDVVRAVGGCDARIFAEDYSLALRVAQRFPIALVDAVLAFGPADEPDRIMVGRKHQTFHDYNLALLNLLADNPDLAKSHRRLAFRRAAGRAWHWARREGGAGWTSKFAWLNWLSYLPLPIEHERCIRATLDAFALGDLAKVRPLIRPG